MSDSAAPLRIAEPGIYQMTHEQYHADPCVIPSFSRSIAKVLIEASPAHARCKHPRLGGQTELGGQTDDQADEAPETPVAQAIEARDIGTASHAAFLQGESVVERVPYDTYQTKAAKQLRDEILASGRVPLKQAKYDQMLYLLEALERYRARTGAFTKGRAEQTLIWQHGPVWCRCRLDWLPDDASEPLWDLKTTPGRASLETWTRRCFDQGSHLQPVFYSRGAAELRDGEVPGGFNFVVAETAPPYGIRRFELSPQAYEVAEGQLSYALSVWEQCQADNRWPGYTDDPEWIDVPVYVLRAWEWSTRSGQGARRIAPARENPGFVDRMIQQSNWGG